MCHHVGLGDLGGGDDSHLDRQWIGTTHTVDFVHTDKHVSSVNVQLKCFLPFVSVLILLRVNKGLFRPNKSELESDYSST